MRSGRLLKHKLKTLSFADALLSPTPAEQKAREQDFNNSGGEKETTQEGPRGGQGWEEPKKTEPFIIRPTFGAIGRELFSRVAATLQEIGKQDVEAPTKADEPMLLPLAQTMSKVLDRCTS